MAPDGASARFLKENAAVRSPVIEIDNASVILTEGKARYRLPKAGAAYDAPWAGGWPRAVREVVTERALLNAAGSFYVLPRTNSGGVARIKPVCTHRKRITDFCSWRGLLVLAGTRAGAAADGRVFGGLWFGDIDDLWKMGKPAGEGGPWKDAAVRAGEPSDPYLMTGYDRKTLRLSHGGAEPVRFTVEVDYLASGVWRPYATLEVPAGEAVTHEFPAGYAAHWVRLRADRDCRATATFVYE